MADMDFPNLLTVSDVADRLRVEPRTVRKWIQEQRLIGLRLPGGDWRVLPEDFTTFLKQIRVQAGGTAQAAAHE
jgi:excisionase family DNA binding protein